MNRQRSHAACKQPQHWQQPTIWHAKVRLHQSCRLVVQVLPLVEAFFQLGNARMTAQGPQGTGQDSRGIGIPPLPTGTTPGPPSLTPQPSMELVGRASVAGDAQGGPSAEASETSVAERQAPFIR